MYNTDYSTLHDGDSHFVVVVVFFDECDCDDVVDDDGGVDGNSVVENDRLDGVV